MARFQLIVSMVIVGTIGLFVEELPVPSFTVALCRVALAAIAIGVYLLLTRQRIRLAGMGKELLLLLISGSCLGLNLAFLLEAYRHIPYAIATLCDYFAPVVVMLLTPLVFREKLTAKQILCFAMATVGLMLMIGVSGNGEKLSLYGVTIGLCGMLFYVPVMMINRAIKHISGIQRTFLQFSAATVVLAVIAAGTGGISFAGMAPIHWAKLLTVGVVHTGVSFCMFFSALPKLPGQEGAILSYADPLTAVLVSVFLMHEHLSVIQIVGAMLLLGFTLLNELSTTHSLSLSKHK